jgi:hypothetical protein
MNCPCRGGCASRLRSERSKSNEASPESRGFARRPWRNGDNCWNVAGAMPVRPGWPPELPPTMGRTPDGVSEPLLSGQHSPRFQVALGTALALRTVGVSAAMQPWERRPPARRKGARVSRPAKSLAPGPRAAKETPPLPTEPGHSFPQKTAAQADAMPLSTEPVENTTRLPPPPSFPISERPIIPQTPHPLYGKN